jgi:hypothetical protein
MLYIATKVIIVPGLVLLPNSRCAACRMSGLPSESVGQVQRVSDGVSPLGRAADQSLGDTKLSGGEHDLLAGRDLLSLPTLAALCLH